MARRYPSREMWTTMILVSILILTALGVWTVQAAGTCYSKSNFAGLGSTAKACKYNFIDASQDYWRSSIQSYMNPSVNIQRIGWWWWTEQHWCGPIVIASWDHGGAVDYNDASKTAQSNWHWIYYCSPDKYPQGWNNGKHDFNHYGSTYEPTFTYAIALPSNP